MALKFDVGDWLDESIDTLNIANEKVVNIMKASVWEGAKEIADNVASAAAEHGLADGVKISHILASSDGADAVIFFDGYFNNRWGQKVPYLVAVNALESGRSSPAGVVGKHPFFRRALNKANAKSKQAMIAKFEKTMQKILDGGK